jgi:hypothetical protein
MRVEKLARRDPHEALRDDSGGFWSPKNVIRRNWAMEKLAATRPEHYSDELLVLQPQKKSVCFGIIGE